MQKRQLNEISREDIRVVYAGPENATPGSRFGPVIRSVCIIECCTGGQGSVIINGHEFDVNAGKCYVLLPGDTVIHTSNINKPREGCWCALDGVSIGVHLKSIGISSEAPFAPSELFPEICRWMEQLIVEMKCRDAGAQLRQTACAYGLLGSMLQNKPATQKSSMIDVAIGLMQTHYPDPLSVGSLADHVGLERTYFSELFKKKTGLSPYQYLTRLRIQKACQLLAQGYRVAETSYLVGMEPHNFGRVFKKEIGNSPRDYLHNIQNNHNLVLGRQVQL